MLIKTIDDLEAPIFVCEDVLLSDKTTQTQVYYVAPLDREPPCLSHTEYQGIIDFYHKLKQEHPDQPEGFLIVGLPPGRSLDADSQVDQ